MNSLKTAGLNCWARAIEMIRIFADKGTDRKVAMWVPKPSKQTLHTLRMQFGGTWVWVDDLQPGEALEVKDGLQYHGKEVDRKRYCRLIVKVEEKMI
jgi:hypothetical protein